MPKHLTYVAYIPVSDLERAIAGLARFEQKCPLQNRLLGHFGALQKLWIQGICHFSLFKTF